MKVSASLLASILFGTAKITTALMIPAILDRAGDITIYCTNTPIDYVDAEHAASALGDYCDTMEPLAPSSKISWVEHKTRVFACNWSDKDSLPCNYTQIERAQKAIASKCSLNMGGFWTSDDGEKTYGNVDSGEDWCGGLDDV